MRNFLGGPMGQRGVTGLGNSERNRAYTGSMSQDAIAAEQQRFMVRVYNWMTAGLGITGFMAFFVANNETLVKIIFGNPIIPIVLMIAQIGLVFYLAARVHHMSASQAQGVFILYAGLTGVTFSMIFLV